MTRLISPMAPSLSESLVEPSLTILNFNSRMTLRVAIRPFLKLFRKLVVRHQIDGFQIGHRRQVIHHPLDHWLARYFEQRFGFVLREWIQPVA